MKHPYGLVVVEGKTHIYPGGITLTACRDHEAMGLPVVGWVSMLDIAQQLKLPNVCSRCRENVLLHGKSRAVLAELVAEKAAGTLLQGDERRRLRSAETLSAHVQVLLEDDPEAAAIARHTHRLKLDQPHHPNSLIGRAVAALERGRLAETALADVRRSLQETLGDEFPETGNLTVAATRLGSELANAREDLAAITKQRGE